MKHKGSKSEMSEELALDLYKVYKDYVKKQFDAGEVIVVSDILLKTVNSPAKRFYVSDERAVQVVCSLIKNPHGLLKMNPTKREMYEEILRRVGMAKKQMPRWSLKKSVTLIIEQPAPKFYVTLGSAQVIISKMKRKWFEEEKRRLRHLFM